MTKLRKTAICAIAAIAAAAATAAYFALDPATCAVFPRCPFYVLTGLKCPGCGSQRALHCLLHMDIAGAAANNFLLVAALPLVALLAASELLRKRKPRLYAAVNSARLCMAVFAVITACWVARNIMGW